MATPRKREADEVSLFPFLSILACLIGALTLVISGLTVASIGQGQEDESVKRADEHDLLSGALARVRAEIEALGRRHAAYAEQQRALAALDDQLVALRQAVDEREREADAAEKDAAALREQTLRTEAEIANRKRELRERELAMGKLDKRVAERRAPPPDPQVVILPADRTGDAPVLRPRFVEVAKRGIAFRRGGERIEVAPKDIAEHAGFTDLLREVEADAAGQIVFLLRADAYGVWSLTRAATDQIGPRYGLLPIRGSGAIDLSKFGRGAQ